MGGDIIFNEFIFILVLWFGFDLCQRFAHHNAVYVKIHAGSYTLICSSSLPDNFQKLFCKFQGLIPV